MVVFNLLKHAWLQSLRSKAFYKNLFVNIFIGFLALYMAVMFLFLGFGLGNLLEEIPSSLNPVELVSGAMLYLIIGSILVRFFMQQLTTLNLSLYQTIPVKRSTLVDFLLLKPLSSPINYFTLLIVIPFAMTSVTNHSSGTVAWGFVLTFIFSIWFDSLFTAFLKRKFGASLTSFFVMLSIPILFIVLEYFHLFSLFDFSGLIFGFLWHHSWACLFVFILPFIAFIANKRFFAQNYYPEHFNRKITATSTVDTTNSPLSLFNRFGIIGEFISLELKLLLRHKRTKSILYMSLLFLLYGLLFYTNDLYLKHDGLLFFVAIFITGLLMFMYGQWIIGWDSSYFDGLMTKSIPIRSYMTAIYYLLVIFNLLCFMLTTPYFFFGTKIIQMQITAFIFNTGVNIPILLFFATYNTKRINLAQGTAFNFQGTTFKNFLVVVPIMILPMIIVGMLSLFAGIAVALWTLTIIGVLGMIFHKYLITICVNQFNKRKYRLAQGFRESE
jgi:hypothetical protein